MSDMSDMSDKFEIYIRIGFAKINKQIRRRRIARGGCFFWLVFCVFFLVNSEAPFLIFFFFLVIKKLASFLRI